MTTQLADIGHEFLDVNGVRLHVATAGPEQGPLLILLHGFPEFWYAWRYQIAAFAELGYRVLVPDQRGYNLSQKPRRLSAYRLNVLVGDAEGLIDAAGRRRAFVVGHDWGGAVAWALATGSPDRVERLGILNAPHPLVMRRFLRHDSAQRRRSWYFFLFQLPWLPERRMRRNNWEIGERAIRGTSRPGTFSDEDMQLYRRAWSQPGAARGMLQWYRAALRRPWRAPRPARVPVPTLVVWGGRDRFLGREMITPSLERCDRGRVELFEQASHWIQHEEPAAVNDLLSRFFEESSAKRA